MIEEVPQGMSGKVTYWKSNKEPRGTIETRNADEPVTYGAIKKYIPNPYYDSTVAKAIKGRGRYRYGRRRYYRRRYYRRGRRGYFRGRGAYQWDDRGIGANVGGMAGAYIGSAIGGAVEGLARSFVGLGDYKIKGNALIPGFDNPNPHGGNVFHGCEYLGDLISSGTQGAFSIQNFPINPALETTFPKLSQFLVNYDQYVIEGMYFEFRSMSADSLNSTNTALGQVIMACNYNVLQPIYKSKQEMEEYEGGTSVVPSQSLKYFIECDRAQSPMDILYTRQGAIPANADLRMYDLGNMQIATNGLQGQNVNLGEIWVCFQIAGLKSKIFTGLGNYNNALDVYYSSYTNASPLGGATPTTVTYAEPKFVSNAMTKDEPCWTVGAGGTALFFPQSPLPQSYVVNLYWVGSLTAITLPTLTGTNCTIQQLGGAGQTGNSVTSAMMLFYALVNPNVLGSVALSAATLPATGDQMNIRVYQVPNLIEGI